MIQIDVLLLVEDDENDVIITKRKIGRSSVPIKQILVVGSVKEAEEVLKSQNVDVMILDLNLPDSRGLDTLDSIMKVYNGIIIVLTSIDDTLIGIEAISKGADDFLVKSQLNERELGRSIFFSIERRKARQAQLRISENLNKLDNLMKTAK